MAAPYTGNGYKIWVNRKDTHQRIGDEDIWVGNIHLSPDKDYCKKTSGVTIGPDDSYVIFETWEDLLKAIGVEGPVIEYVTVTGNIEQFNDGGGDEPTIENGNNGKWKITNIYHDKPDVTIHTTFTYNGSSVDFYLTNRPQTINTDWETPLGTAINLASVNRSYDEVVIDNVKYIVNNEDLQVKPYREDPYTFALSPAIATVESTATTQTFTVTATNITNVGWDSVNSINVTGGIASSTDATANFTENISTSQDKQIKFAISGKTSGGRVVNAIANLTQSHAAPAPEYYFIISANPSQVPASGGNVTITISSNATWDLTTTVGTLSKNSGVSGDTVTLSIPEYHDGGRTITVSGVCRENPSVSGSVDVSQSEGAITYELSITAATNAITACGQLQLSAIYITYSDNVVISSRDVTDDALWSVSQSDYAEFVDGQNGLLQAKNNSTINPASVTVNSEYAGSHGNYNVEISAATSVSHRVEVIPSAATVNPNETTRLSCEYYTTIHGNNCEYTFSSNETGNASWSSDNAYVEVSGGVVTGKNDTNEDKISIVTATVSGTSGSAEITSKAANAYLHITPYNETIPASGGTYLFLVEWNGMKENSSISISKFSNATTVISPTTISNAGASGNRDVLVTFSDNGTGSSRRVGITATGTSIFDESVTGTGTSQQLSRQPRLIFDSTGETVDYVTEMVRVHFCWENIDEHYSAELTLSGAGISFDSSTTVTATTTQLTGDCQSGVCCKEVVLYLEKNQSLNPSSHVFAVDVAYGLNLHAEYTIVQEGMPRPSIVFSGGHDVSYTAASETVQCEWESIDPRQVGQYVKSVTFSAKVDGIPTTISPEYVSSYIGSRTISVTFGENPTTEPRTIKIEASGYSEYDGSVVSAVTEFTQAARPGQTLIVVEPNILSLGEQEFNVSWIDEDMEYLTFDWDTSLNVNAIELLSTNEAEVSGSSDNFIYYNQRNSVKVVLLPGGMPDTVFSIVLPTSPDVEGTGRIYITAHASGGRTQTTWVEIMN